MIRKIFILIGMAVGTIFPLMQTKDNVTVLLRKVPLPKITHTDINQPLLLTVVNAKNIPLLIAPASISLPFRNLFEASMILVQQAPPWYQLLVGWVSYAVGLAGFSGSWGMGLIILDRNALEHKYLAAAACFGGGILSLVYAIGGLIIATQSAIKDPYVFLNLHYLDKSIAIAPGGSADKLIWFETNPKTTLSISVFLPTNDPIVFTFSPDELAAIA